MIYLFISFVLAGIAIPCFEHGRVIIGICFMLASCFMPVLKDMQDRGVPPIIIEPPKREKDARIDRILNQLDTLQNSVNRCSELLGELSRPLQ